jgi:TRAP-type C4-dicarboxylate transport system permease small subunit
VVASSPQPRVPGRALAALHRLEDGVLALLLGAMIVLAPLQIILRSALDTSIVWADPLLRVLVLWVGLLGAVAASRDHRQITVDVLSRVLSGRAVAAAATLTSLFTAAVAGIVATHGVRFVVSEFRFESVAFSGIPAWALASVIPFAFAVIAVRNGIRSVSNFRSLFGNDGGSDDESDGDGNAPLREVPAR